jgi:pimeloyl-ACP methyl ester carboxylesterase
VLTLALVYVLGTLLFFKGLGALLRWYEVTNEPDFVPAGRVGQWARGVWPFLREYLTTLVIGAVWLVDMPWRLYRRTRPEPEVLPASPGVVPVILVHGFSLTPWTMAFLLARLRSAGHGPLHLLDYRPMLGDIDTFAGQLADLVDRAAGSGPGAGPADIVGHSMGGLIAARYMTGHPGRVRSLVAIGTPFHGTRLWAMSVGRCLPQMRPGGPFLREVLEHPAFPGGTRITCIYSDFDQIVLPWRSSRLEAPGARNVALSGLGHTALLLSPRVASETVAGLAAGAAGAASGDAGPKD